MVALLDAELLLDDGEVLVDGEDDVELLGLVVELLEEVEDEVLDELELEVELDVGVQSWAASALTVPAPWPRFCSRVGSTDCGSLATALLSSAAALWAPAQSWAATAEEMALRLLARLLLCPDESSPLLLPHATTKATVNPRPPARNAREPKPIRRLTLDAVPVCLTLRGCGAYCP